VRRMAAILFIASGVVAQTNDPQALRQLGRDAVTHGDPDKAIEYFEKAVALKPNNADYHYQLANAYGLATVDAGMFKAMSIGTKAKAELERAVQLDPNFIQARFALMEFYLVAPAIVGGSQSGALEQAAEIRKRDAIDGHRAFARTHAAAKEPELVRKEYVDMLKEQPASARAHHYFGVYLMGTEKNYKSATDEFEAALKVDPSYMPAYFQIGHTAALAANNFARGEEALKKYLMYKPKEDEPPIARAHYWLGAIYEKQGKKAEAKASYAASLKINPNQKDVNEAIKRVS
jgi:tetratricopeptide (TPR) repeat protein